MCITLTILFITRIIILRVTITGTGIMIIVMYGMIITEFTGIMTTGGIRAGINTVTGIIDGKVYLVSFPSWSLGTRP
jgi:hypothetical protein